MDINVTVKGAKLVALNDLKGTQGNMKFLDDASYEKFKQVILKHGFSEPITVWEKNKKYYILNGHQRLTLLKRMVSEGYKCPKIPISVVSAKSLKDAKKHVLSLASQYGKFDQKGVFDFLQETDISIDEFKTDYALADFGIESFESAFFGTTEEEIEVKKPKKDKAASSQSKLKHTCPSCGFEFDNGK